MQVLRQQCCTSAQLHRSVFMSSVRALCLRFTSLSLSPFPLPLPFPLHIRRVKSIENDGRYKRTWGTGDNNSVEGGEGGVVSNQPTSLRNGEAMPKVAVASGGYITRWAQL